MPEDFLSPKQVAQLMKCSLGTVKNRVADGTLPAVKFGKLIRIPASALEVPDSDTYVALILQRAPKLTEEQRTKLAELLKPVRQLPDGTLILTSPAGRTYVTTPGSALLFPSLCHAVGGMPAPEADLPPDHRAQRSAMMPKRRRTRAQNRAHRIAVERRANHQARQTRRAEYSNTGPAPPDDDPPPF